MSTTDRILVASAVLALLAYLGTVLLVLYKHTYTLRELLEYAKGQSAYIEQKRAEAFCKERGLNLCSRCRLRPTERYATLCEQCGI